jgi:hypothetical protein
VAHNDIISPRRRGSVPKAKPAEFSLWIERHARRSRTPHQRYFLRSEPIGSINQVRELALYRKHSRCRSVSWGKSIRILLLYPRYVRRGKFMAFGERRTHNRDKCLASLR